MTALTPTSAENCRKMAEEAGSRAQLAWYDGRIRDAWKALRRQSDMLNLAAQFESTPDPIVHGEAS